MDRAVKRIDSSTVYIEADLFYLLTNEVQAGKMVKAMEGNGGGGEGGRRLCDLHKVDFGFSEKANRVELVARGAGDGGTGRVNFLTKKEIFKKRKKMWRERKGEIEILPNWMEWKPETIAEEKAKLRGNLGEASEREGGEASREKLLYCNI